MRFRAPVAHAGWNGVRNATVHGNICPQVRSSKYDGDEDCLFLNVYSRDLKGNRTVMLWIHGGSFSGGSGNSGRFGPEFLLDEDIVLVTINYRLGALGFLTTNDRSAPGNYGMKDMVEALKWVKRNIAAFGGDPENVTIFGESAGSVAVHFLVLSRMASGLFQKAIIQSGVALNMWGFATTPYRWTDFVAGRVNITNTLNTAELVSQLRLRTAEDIARATPDEFIDYDIPRGWSHIPFVPSLDPSDSLEPIFLHDTPRRIIESGDYNRVPLIIGYLDAESLIHLFEQDLDKNTFPTINENPASIIPPFWNVPVPSVAADTIVADFSEKYFNGQPLSDNFRHEYTVLVTDHHFILESDEAVRLHSETMNEPVYYYVFTFVGELNLVKIANGLSAFPGAVHADDLNYLFSQPGLPVLQATNPAAITRRRFLRMWANFAKYGNPTAILDSDVSVNWEPVNGYQEYLEIGNELVPGILPTYDRVSVWNDLRERFANVTS